jgi:hypothetical protein
MSLIYFVGRSKLESSAGQSFFSSGYSWGYALEGYEVSGVLDGRLCGVMVLMLVMVGYFCGGLREKSFGASQDHYWFLSGGYYLRRYVRLTKLPLRRVIWH